MNLNQFSRIKTLRRNRATSRSFLKTRILIIASLVFVGGLITGRVTAADLYVGQAAGSNETEDISGQSSYHWVYVGYFGTGTLNIESGGYLQSSDAYVGTKPNSSGIVNVSGTWSTDFLDVGYSGTGTLNIEKGGYVSSEIGRLGSYSHGTANVRGIWLSGYLGVGSSGAGTLNIEEGGYVSADRVFLGNDAPNSSGIANVSGTLLISNKIHNQFAVGDDGTGTLNIKRGGYVSNESTLYLGYSGTGTLNIEEGGYFSNTTGYLGREVGSHGIANVSGTWLNSGDLEIGDSGTGTLNIEKGGYVSNESGYMGGFPSGIATVTVSGTWSNSGLLHVGYSGTGTLNIESGGVVMASSVSFGVSNRGTINLNEGGILITEGVGNINLTGSMIFNGGTVRATKDNGTYFSNFAPGAMWITNRGAIFDSNGFDIGFSTGLLGVGELTKLGAGTLTLTGSHRYSGGTTVRSGTLVVSNSIPHEKADTVVGSLGGDVGTLVISASGGITSRQGILGSGSNSVGTAIVSGSWINSGSLVVGRYGTGSLNIQTDGVVSGSTITIGGITAASGTINVNSGGVLVAGQLTKGLGNAKVTFSGGTVRATQDNNNYFSNFAFGDVTIASDGVIFDSNGYNIGFSTGLSGSGGLTKSGSGTLSLTGSNIYAGVTSVAAGTLKVNGGLHGNGALTVQNGATLSGTGVVTGGVTINDGGILSAGNSPGKLTLGSLSLSSGAISNFELGTTSDLVAVTGDLTLGGILNITGITGFANDTYTLFTYTGELVNNYFTLDLVPAEWNRAQFTIDLTTAGKVNLLVNNSVTIQYWDGPNTGAHGAPSGGDGVWSSAGNNWTNSNGSLNSNWLGAVAVFTGSAGTVSVADTVSFNQLQFNTDGYLIEGDGSLVASGSAEINTASNVSAEISAAISGNGTDSIVKTGSGTLTLSGSNSYGGGTAIQSGTLVVDGTISHASSDMVVSSHNRNRGALIISASGAVFDRSGVIGTGEMEGPYASLSNGMATVSGTWVNSGTMIVGYSGTGTLNIEKGGYVSNTLGYVGHRSLSTGTAIVSGTWINSRELTVGENGSGTLIINEGGYVSGSMSAVGRYSNGYGTVVVSGTWLNELSLSVNYGTLDILDGGYVRNSRGYIGTSSAASGTVTVSGTWSNSVLIVGFYGAGTLNIEDGGVVVSNDESLFGAAGTASGVLNLNTGGTLETGALSKVEGSASLNFNGGTLRATKHNDTYFSNFASSDVTLASGGGIFDSNGFNIGVSTALSGSGGLTKSGSGTLTLSGSNSYQGGTTVRSGTLAVKGSITHSEANTVVGSESGDQGALVISAGASVFNSSGYIGYSSDSIGTATVSGTWVTAANLYVGLWGGGTLDVLAGGSVVADYIRFGGANAGSGYVKGAMRSDRLYVGEYGNGTLDIASEGYVFSNLGFIGLQDGSVNSVTVSGTWENATQLAVGASGAGSLTINAGGYVSGARTYIGALLGSSGNATVDGILESDNLYVGSEGVGLLTINSGGRVTASSVLTIAGFNDPDDSTAESPDFGDGTILVKSGGLLSAGSVLKEAGKGLLSFDGGELRAMADQNDYLTGFVNGEVMFESGGAIFNTNGYHIGINSELSGTGGLTKSGSGTLALSGSSNYAGATSVTAGTLKVNGGLYGGGALTVEGGATLGGTGVVSGGVTIKDGGILSAGNSPGTLTLGSLSLSSGAISNFELGTSSDLVAVTGDLTLGGILNITGISGFTNTEYTLFTYGGDLVNNYFTLELVPTGWNLAQFKIDLDTRGVVKLLVDNSVTVQYWDGANDFANGGPSGGDGIWNVAGTNWTNSNGSVNTNWKSVVAVFSGSAGTVSVGGDVTFTQLHFETDGYTIEEDGGSLLASGTAQLYAATGVSAEIYAGIGENGTASIVKTGSGMLTLSGSNGYQGGTTVQSGTLAVNGSISHDAADLVVGSRMGDNGTLVINKGATVSNNAGALGADSGSVGTAILGGTWVHSGSLAVGRNGTGVLEIQQTGYLSAVNVALGNGAGSSGTGTITGTLVAEETLYVGLSGTGELTIEQGGYVSSVSSDVGSNLTANGTVTVSGTWNNTGNLILGRAGSGTLNIENGTLITGALSKGSGTASVTLDGGTLRARSSTATYLSGFGDGDITFASGGATIDTNGFDIGVSAPLSGSGGLTKSGSGTLVLSGSSSYSGGTVITTGTVETRNQYAFGSGDVSLQEGTTLKATGGVNIGGGFFWNGGTLELALGTATDTIHITGALDNSGGGHEFLLSAGSGYAVNTAYTLLTFNSSSVFSLADFTANVIADLGASFRLVDTGNTLQVIYLGAAIIDGSGVEMGEGTTTPEVESIVFTDEGGSVIVRGTLPVVSGTITSGTGNASIVDGTLVTEEEFRIDSDGSLTITSTLETGTTGGGVVKTGSGRLVLFGSNGYTGNTRIEDGILGVANESNLGVGGDVEIDGGILQALGTFSTERDALLGENGGGVDVVANQTLTWNGIIIDGTSNAGGLSKSGSGTLVLTHSNSYTGGTTIDGGTLRAENTNALGSGSVVLNAGGTLDVATTLKITDFTWNGGGVISLSPQSGHLLTIDGAWIKGTPGIFAFDFASEGFDFNATYTLVTFNANSGFSLDDFSAPVFFGITPNFFFETDGSLAVRYLGASTGSVIDNKAPTFTPYDSNFVVSGAVSTSGTEDSNTVNSLLFQNGSSLQVYNRLTVTAGSLTVIDGAATVHGGEVYAPGDLTKSGQGTLISDADLTAVGAAVLQEGALIVNGTLTAGNGATVGNSALLGGSGYIVGNVTNNGVVSPGNSPGTLTITGDYDQSSYGAFLMEIAGKNNFDRLIVSGVATLSGVLEVIPYAGYQLEYGQKFAFIKSDRIRGEFDEINLPSGLRGRILAEDGDATLLVAPESYTQLAQTPNQRNVASALDSFIGANGDRDTVSIALDELSADEYAGAFNQIAPTFYESLANITIEQNNAQGQMLQQRFGAVRFGGIGSRGFSQIGLDAPIVAEKKTATLKDGPDIMEASGNNPWGVWAQANGIFGKTSGINDVRSYDTDSGGFLLGADYRWNDQFTSGLYTGYQATKSRYDGGGDTSINAARFGAYATLDAGNGFYANGLIGGGFSDYEVRRTIDFGSLNRTARSNPNGAEFTTMLGSGYDWNAGGFTFGPVASAQYTYVNIGGATETGAKSLNLQLADQEAHSLRTTLGARVAYTWELNESIRLTPEIRASWQHEFLQGSRTLNSILDGGSGPGFNYATTAASQDAFFAGAGFNLQLGNRWSANVYYNLNCGSGDFQSHMLSGGVNLSF